MWLRDGIEGTAYFAEENGQFDFSNLEPFTTLDVEGPDLRTSQPSSSNITVDSVNPRTSTPHPLFKSVVASKKGPIHSIKVSINTRFGVKCTDGMH